MELKDFISKSIQDICYGILEARKIISNELNNHPVAPAFMQGELAVSESKIDFDIAVTTSKSNVTSKKGEVSIKVLGGDMSNAKEKSIEEISRLKFSVPFYPQALNKREEGKSKG